MTSRFLSNLLVLLVGALMMGAHLAFAPPAAAWLMFAGACAVAMAVAGALPVRGRGTPQRLLDLCVLTIAAWSVIASRTFDAGTASWLGFAEGGTCALCALGGLIAHEVRMQRGVVGPGVARPQAVADDPAQDGPSSPAARMTVASWPS